MKHTDTHRLDEPTQVTQISLTAVVMLRKFLLRHFFLPRFAFLRMRWFTTGPDRATGRYHFLQYIGYPWYIKPTLAQRWNLKSWILWLTGGYVPSKHLPKYRSEGYKIAELGPTALESKGIEEMHDAKQTVIAQFHGCPFSS